MRGLVRRAACAALLTAGAGGCTADGRAAAPRAAAAAAPAGAAPDTVEYASGALRLRGLVYRPVGRGPHPAVLFLHGSGSAYDRQAAAVGPLYAAEGFLLFVPFRRGQGLSAGRGVAIGDVLSREQRARGRAGEMRLMATLLASEQMDDVLAALAFLKRLDGVDSARVAVAGNSFGGILSVFSAERAPGIRAAVASAPAALTWADAPELRVRLLASARRARVPLLLFQAANDRNLEPTAALDTAMTAAGRPHVRRVFPAFGRTMLEGHGFGYFGGAQWGPVVFPFLRTHLGLPAR